MVVLPVAGKWGVAVRIVLQKAGTDKRMIEGLLHIKRFTGGDNHPGDTAQLIGQSRALFRRSLTILKSIRFMRLYIR